MESYTNGCVWVIEFTETTEIFRVIKVILSELESTYMGSDLLPCQSMIV